MQLDLLPLVIVGQLATQIGQMPKGIIIQKTREKQKQVFRKMVYKDKCLQKDKFQHYTCREYKLFL